MDDVAVFDRLTAATVATHLTLMKPGDVVTEISEAISDPIASRRCKSNSIVIFAVSRCRRMLTPVQRTVPGHQSVLPRPPVAPRDFEQPLPAFRRQSELRRIGGILAASAASPTTACLSMWVGNRMS